MLNFLPYIKDFVQIGLDVLQTRIPFRINAGVHNDHVTGNSTVYVTIINRTKDNPLYVHSVRIHFGQPDYTYSFVLSPYGTQKIEPRNKRDFAIAYVNAKVQRRMIVEKVLPGHDNFPSFSNPAHLFHAIANGDRRKSWIEVDFNEFKDRRFQRGKVNVFFRRVAEINRERAKATPGNRPQI